MQVSAPRPTGQLNCPLAFPGELFRFFLADYFARLLVVRGGVPEYSISAVIAVDRDYSARSRRVGVVGLTSSSTRETSPTRSAADVSTTSTAPARWCGSLRDTRPASTSPRRAWMRPIAPRAA